MDDTRRKLSIFLKEEYIKYAQSIIANGGNIPSQADFAAWLSISTTAFSLYLNEKRLPDTKQTELLASKLGFEIYDIVGLPPRMPNDKNLMEIIKVWPLITLESQKKLVDLAKNFSKQSQP